MNRRRRILSAVLALLLAVSGCAGSAPDVSAPPSASEPQEQQEQAEDSSVSAAPVTPAQPRVQPRTVLGIELTDAMPLRERNWIKDLDRLRREYERFHVKPYDKEKFEWDLSRLATKAGKLSDNDLAFEVVALIAGMDDIHTSATVPDQIDDRCFPLNVRYYGDSLYLTGYLEGYKQFEPWLLHEIVAVNGLDMAYLRRKFESLLSPTNSWGSKERFARWYFEPDFFDWAGCDYREGYTFQFLNENQEVVSVEVPVLSVRDFAALLDKGAAVNAQALDAIPYLKGGNWAAYFEEEKDDFVYMSFTEQPTESKKYYQELFETTAALIRQHPDCDKLVIDLRRHFGGEADAIKYLRELTQLLKVPTVKHAYILTGGITASAAMGDLCMFKSELNAVTVGEPTGQFTSFYAFHNMSTDYPRFRLPYSNIGIFVPNHRFSINALMAEQFGYPALTEEYYDEEGNLYEWENTILPDAFVRQDIEDIRQGKDSVIEWVLAQ